MDKFVNNIFGLVEESKGWLIKLGVPVFVVVGLFLLVLFATASDQNKGKYKNGLIALLVIVILFAGITYVIPWLYTRFS